MIKRKFKIKAPIAKVYSVIRDFESYPEFIPSTSKAKEKKVKDAVHVDFAINIVKDIKYTLKFEIEEPHSISWELVSGDLMKKNSGSWSLKELSPTETEAVYSIDVDFGWLVPKMIIEKVTEVQLPETLNAFKTRAEELA